MKVKSWVLDRAHRVGGLAARGDLPRRDPAPDTAPAPGDGSAGPESRDAASATVEHLGAYAGLIGAVRRELEHFVASHVRLHLAIAERDRFLLTSIRVQCRDAAKEGQRLREFLHEFKPEQVRRFLAREVIGALPNAAAIDLSQFAGLVDGGDPAARADDGDEYRELLEALRGTPDADSTPPYEVSIVGRWAEPDAVRPAAAAPARAPAAAPVSAAAGAVPTPMGGQRCELEIEDAGGRRRAVLHAVVPGRRYVIGKAETCDVRVEGTYASRRHAELWLDDGLWWVVDAGSTNGIRVEPPGGPGAPAAPAGDRPVALVEGARVVLSARAQGPASDYPSVSLSPPPQRAAARITPIAASWVGAPKTPLTSVLPQRAAEPAFTLTTMSGSAPRTHEVLRPGALPVSVGRSRQRTVVIDRIHEGVSGHHLDIVDLDADGAEVTVLGDNGVLLDTAFHGPGSRFHWRPGQSLVLGGSPPDAPPCRLTLARGAAK